LLWGIISGLTVLALSATPLIALAATRFTDNHDGTVTDNRTGLVWLKDAHCRTPLNGIAKNATGSLNWRQAMTWTATLANGSCGLRDGSQAGQWRLPSQEEWAALIDRELGNPVLPADHPFTHLQPNYYWSSTTYASDTDRAWFVYLGRGDGVDAGVKTSSLSVWPVRDELSAALSAPAAPRFTDNHDGTVIDNRTGLIWLKNAHCRTTLNGIKNIGSLNWRQAMTWTATLANGSCGLRDGSQAGQWRLPSRNELQSLIDTVAEGPALPVGHTFTAVQIDYGYWSTTPADSTGTMWTVNFFSGTLYERDKTSTDYYVWPVRGGQ
jgi:hypothetical protein